MNDPVADELGPIDWVVVEFPGGKASLAGALALELASLVDAELIRVLDLVVVDKGTDGRYEVREFEDLGEADALGELRALGGELGEVLALEDLEHVVDALDGRRERGGARLGEHLGGPARRRGASVWR